MQRHINEEKVAMEGGGGAARPSSSMGVRGHRKAPPPLDHGGECNRNVPTEAL